MNIFMWNHVKSCNITWTSKTKITKDTIACTIQLLESCYNYIYRDIARKINNKCNQPNTRDEAKCLQIIYINIKPTQSCPIAVILVQEKQVMHQQWFYHYSLQDASTDQSNISSQFFIHTFNKNDSHTVLHVHCISNARNGRLHPDHLMSVLEAVMRACKSWKTCPNPFISYILMRPEVELVLK